MKSSYQKIIFICLCSVVSIFFNACERESPCNTIDCGQYGHCTIDSNGDPVCDCDDGYFGTPCQAIDLCPPGVCENGGTCLIDDFGNAYCECAEGFTGVNCSEIDACFEANCQGNTTCNLLPDGTYECICLDGYEDGDNPPCDVEMRAKFLGTYDMLTVCYPTSNPSNTSFYSDVCTISGTDTNNVRRIAFDNFGDLGTEVYGLVIESNGLVVPLQYADKYISDNDFNTVLARGIETSSLVYDASDTIISLWYKYEEDEEITCQILFYLQ